MTKTLAKIQKDYFDQMSRLEVKEAIFDAKQQLSVIACSVSKAADRKREELDARIAYLDSRLRILSK